MANYVIKKWIEPYVLLETLKSHYEMKELIFDGFSKKTLKNDFIGELQKGNAFGLYMKNVNKFYIFRYNGSFNLENLFGFSKDDYSLTEAYDEALNMVDMGKAEAAVILF